MSFKTTLLVLLLFVISVGLYVGLDQKPTETTTTELTISQKYHLPVEQVRKVTVTGTRVDLLSYILTKIGTQTEKGWEIAPLVTKEKKIKANPEVVNQLLVDLLEKKIKRQIEVTDLSLYQLDPAQIRVEVWTGSVDSIVLLIGKKTADYSVYVKAKKAPDVFLVESSLVSDVTLPLSHFQATDQANSQKLEKARLLDFQRTDCHRIEIEKGQKKVVCQKIETGWQIVEPSIVQLEAKTVSDLLFGVDSLRIEQDLEQSLETVSLTITFLESDTRPTVLKLGQARGDLVTVSLEQSTDTYLVRSRFLQPLETILKRSGSELIRDFDQLVIDAEMTNRGIQQSN